jgi:frataxin-like iron-binding protein CyaY
MNAIVRVQRVVARSNKLRPLAATLVDPHPVPTTTCQSLDSNIVHRRNFHSTPQIQMAIRHRRRSARHREAEETEEGYKNPLKHESVMDTATFCQEASNLLTKLEAALAPMKSKNDIFIVTREDGEIGEMLTIDLGPKEGTYRIEVSELEHMFEYSSPISGKLLYILSSETGTWVGVEDGHSFEGLLVRDLIRQCRGLPKL